MDYKYVLYQYFCRKTDFSFNLLPQPIVVDAQYRAQTLRVWEAVLNILADEFNGDSCARCVCTTMQATCASCTDLTWQHTSYQYCRSRVHNRQHTTSLPVVSLEIQIFIILKSLLYFIKLSIFSLCIRTICIFIVNLTSEQ